MVGSYAMPGWLERLKTDYFARRISRHDLDEIYDAAAKAAIKDQEIAGLDIVTDGEPRRDNMVDYFVERLPGVQIDRSSKKFYYDFYDSAVQGKLPMASLGLVQDFHFLQSFTERQTKFCITGPHCLTKRIRNQFYPSEEALAMDIAQVMNLELKALVKAGATYIQIDEPYYSGFPEDLPWGVKALNTMVEGVDAKIAVHICYGNRYGKPSWEGSYRYLFPDDPGSQDSSVDAGICAARRRGSGSVQGVQAPFRAGRGRDRREEPTTSKRRTWWPSTFRKRWK